VWEWYDWRRQLIAAATPNRAHEVLAGWSRQQDGFTLITQNVDGLHERAGTRNVIRFHGSIWELRCLESCRGPARHWDDARVPLPEVPAKKLGWAIVGLGNLAINQILPALRQSDRALDCDVCLVVGTSSLVYPAAGLAAVARERGPMPSRSTEPGARRCRSGDRGKSGEVLDRMDSLIR
jgi:NAD-dependent deacetylase